MKETYKTMITDRIKEEFEVIVYQIIDYKNVIYNGSWSQDNGGQGFKFIADIELDNPIRKYEILKSECGRYDIYMLSKNRVEITMRYSRKGYLYLEDIPIAEKLLKDELLNTRFALIKLNYE